MQLHYKLQRSIFVRHKERAEGINFCRGEKELRGGNCGLFQGFETQFHLCIFMNSGEKSHNLHFKKSSRKLCIVIASVLQKYIKNSQKKNKYQQRSVYNQFYFHYTFLDFSWQLVHKEKKRLFFPYAKIKYIKPRSLGRDTMDAFSPLVFSKIYNNLLSCFVLLLCVGCCLLVCFSNRFQCSKKYLPVEKQRRKSGK